MDYKLLGLDKRLRKLSSLANRLTYTPGYKFDSQYEVQTKNLTASSLVGNTSTATASGAFDTGESVTVSAVYTNRSQDGIKTFGIPVAAVYTGTAAVAANQIYPRFGAGIANQKFSIHSGFDYHGWGGLDSTFRINIENNSGTTSSLYAIVQWKKLRYFNEVETLT